MNRLICCVGLFVLVAQVSATKFTDCGSSGQVTKVDVSDCPDTAARCVLKKESQPTISIVFQSKTESKTVKAVVHGVVYGVPIPFHVPKPDGCTTGVTCPMTAGKTFTYANSIKVLSSYPSLDVDVKWELKDDKSKDIVCVKIPCTIQ